MSIINHLPKLETEGHWDSELIGTSIRFPKAPELWTEDELSALYRANGLDTADSSSRIEKAQGYWARMLSARSERIEHDVTYNAHEVRPECALEQPLPVLACGINYSYADAFVLSDQVLTLIAEMEHTTGDPVELTVKPTDTATVKSRINDLVAVNVPGVYLSLFGITLTHLGHGRYEFTLPKVSARFEMTQENYDRTVKVFELAEKMAFCALEKRSKYVVFQDDMQLGGQVKLAIELDSDYLFDDGELKKAVPVKRVIDIFNTDEREIADTLTEKTLHSGFSLSLQDGQSALKDAIHVTCATMFKVNELLERLIQEFYTAENYGSLPGFESVIESESNARRLIEKSENSHGSVIYRVFYNDITSNKLVIETSDWLFALKVYLGHRDINGSMNLGLKAS